MRNLDNLVISYYDLNNNINLKLIITIVNCNVNAYYTLFNSDNKYNVTFCQKPIISLLMMECRPNVEL